MEKENQRRLSGAAQNQASVIAGLEVKLLFSTSGRGRNIFLDIPLYRTACLLGRKPGTRAGSSRFRRRRHPGRRWRWGDRERNGKTNRSLRPTGCDRGKEER